MLVRRAVLSSSLVFAVAALCGDGGLFAVRAPIVIDLQSPAPMTFTRSALVVLDSPADPDDDEPQQPCAVEIGGVNNTVVWQTPSTASLGHERGRYAFEVTVDRYEKSWTRIGVRSELEDSRALRGPVIKPMRRGEVIGVAVDLDNRVITYARDGKVVDRFTIHEPGRLYPSTTLMSGLALRFNFGERPFRHPLPPGYASWAHREPDPLGRCLDPRPSEEYDRVGHSVPGDDFIRATVAERRRAVLAKARDRLNRLAGQEAAHAGDIDEGILDDRDDHEHNAGCANASNP